MAEEPSTPAEELPAIRVEDIEPETPVETPVEAPEEAPETPTEEVAPTPTPPPTEEEPKKRERRNWKENFNVKEMTEVEKVDRLRIIVGVNEYKGQHLVFCAKVTDKEFSRQFFSMPAYVWQRAIPELQKVIPKIAEIEKQSMAESVTKELLRLKELGVDVSAIMDKVK